MYIDLLLADENMVSFDKFIDFDYKINSSDNNEILLGNASAASLTFSLWNGEKQYNTFKFKGSTAYLYKDVERTKKIGVFNVDKVTKDKNSLKFECTDYMTKLDEIFKGISTANGGFTIWQLVNQICTQLEIPLKNTEEDFAHLTQKYNDTNLILGKKCRDIVKWIGEVSTKYAIFTGEGELYFSWYNLDTIKKEIPYNKLKDFARDEEELVITGVSVLIDKEEETIGTKTGYDLRLTTDNPFLKTLDMDTRTSILQDIYNRVYGMNYLSCDISISTDDDISIGDTLKIYDEDGIDYKILVTYLNINKIFSMKITSAGENLNRSVSSGSGDSYSGDSGDKVYITKNENWRDISIKDYWGEVFLNDITVKGITEKSSVYLSFSINFYSRYDDSTIKFKLYVNDNLSKVFPFRPQVGYNTFTWSETANINIDADINVFKFTLDNIENASFPVDIFIEKEKTSLSVLTKGASSAGSNIISNIEFKEEVRNFYLVNETSKMIILNLEDILETSCKEYVHSSIQEQIEALSFKSRPRFNIENINETLE